MRLAVVGAGTGGTKLIKLFSVMDDVDLKCVVDRNAQSPGVVLAKSLGIKCINDIEQIGNDIEVIIEATGNKGVLEKLISLFGGQKRIIQSDVAALLMGIVDQQTATNDRLSFQLDQISSNSEKLHKEMDGMVKVTSELLNINKELVLASEESKKYITQTDEMTKAVNKITQQIKILGLNANIEAARAGEHGKGFSVVATEVQKMSDSTSEFAGQISTLLQSLSQENEKILKEVEKLNQIATNQDRSTNLMKKVLNDLKSI